MRKKPAAILLVIAVIFGMMPFSIKVMAEDIEITEIGLEVYWIDVGDREKPSELNFELEINGQNIEYNLREGTGFKGFHNIDPINIPEGEDLSQDIKLSYEPVPGYYEYSRVYSLNKTGEGTPYVCNIILTFYEKTDATVMKVPKAKDLAWDGKSHALAKAGEAEGGEMQYAIGTDDKTAPEDGWGKDVPEAADPGDYYIWYKVVGDDLHNDSEAGCVKSTITAKQISYTVTFKVENGAWDDKSTEERKVTLSRYENEDKALVLKEEDIPKVGNEPAEGHKEGSWDTVPGTDIEITRDTTYTYTYDKKEEISHTVTFKVVNGSWDDDKTEDVKVTLTGYEGDELKLSADQIPAVGSKPAEHYKAGSWDETPGTGTVISKDTTYTYTYEEKEKISYTVTFKVVNGSWDDGKTADVKVTLTGYEGDKLKLSEDQIPAVGNKPAEGHKEGSWDTVPNTKKTIRKDTAYTYTYAQKEKTVYKVIEGANGKVQKGSEDGITFKTDGDYSKFTGIRIDNRKVGTSLYDSRSGSTIVTLKKACIDLLSVGDHTIEFLYTDGSCSTNFEVQAKATPTKTPTATPTKRPTSSGSGKTAAKTSDTSNGTLWALLLAAAAVCLTAAMLKGKRYRKR